MSDETRITLKDVRNGRRVRILSIDPGARRPGFACIECWWRPSQTEKWPHVKPLLLMGDPVISSEVKNVKKFGRIKCIDALDDFFQAHGAELFGHKPDFTIIETQKGVNNRLIDSLSMVMYVTCRHAHKVFPEHCKQAMCVSMCPATWKTQGLGVPPGEANYSRRKAACVKKANEMLCANGYPITASNIARDEAKNDISDAFMQAVQFFMHKFPRVPAQPKKRKRGKAQAKKPNKKRARVSTTIDLRASKRSRVSTAADNTEAVDLTLSDDDDDEEEDGETSGATMTVDLEGGMTVRCETLSIIERLEKSMEDWKS